MDLYEYESENIIKEAGIKIPFAILVKTIDEAIAAYRELQSKVVVKAQIKSSGRRKAGAIIFCKTESQIKKAAGNLLKSKILGASVNLLLIQRMIKISKEYYLAIIIDRINRKAVFIASTEGGVDIEETALTNPEKILKQHIDPIQGITKYQVQKITQFTNLQNNEEFNKIIKILYQTFIERDCELLEINPLVLTRENNLVAVDTKIIIDDNAIYRQTKFKIYENGGTNLEKEASKEGISFIELEGNIGIIGNGAGLVMATMDLVEHLGSKPADFCDLGGGADTNIIKKALKIVLKHPKIQILILNILGGITNCVEVVNALIESLDNFSIKIPIIVRLAGEGQEEAYEILKKASIYNFSSMEEAVKKAVELEKEVNEKSDNINR